MGQNSAPKKSGWSNIIIGVLVLLLICATAGAAYFYQKSQTIPQKEEVNELQHIIEMVGRHMVLPENETPTLATVSDPEKLKDQPFFARAQKGNKVLIYSRAQKAILYDPVLDKIIEVAPINTGGSNTPTATEASSPPLNATSTTQKTAP